MTAWPAGIDERARSEQEQEQERDPRRPERAGDELVAHLERDQLVAETSRPLPRAVLSGRARAALWALRVFVLVVSAMVLYVFIEQLG